MQHEEVVPHESISTLGSKIEIELIDPQMLESNFNFTNKEQKKQESVPREESSTLASNRAQYQLSSQINGNPQYSQRSFRSSSNDSR